MVSFHLRICKHRGSGSGSGGHTFSQLGTLAEVARLPNRQYKPYPSTKTKPCSSYYHDFQTKIYTYRNSDSNSDLPCTCHCCPGVHTSQSVGPKLHTTSSAPSDSARDIHVTCLPPPTQLKQCSFSPKSWLNTK